MKFDTHKCKIVKGRPCVTYCSDARRDGDRHVGKWRDVDCEKCKCAGLMLGHYQPQNVKSTDKLLGGK